MTTNSELDATFELTEEQEFQLWKESVKADILNPEMENPFLQDVTEDE